MSSEEGTLNIDYLDTVAMALDGMQQNCSSGMGDGRQVDVTVRATTIMSPTARTTTIITAAPIYQTPSIAVTTTTSATSAIATKRSGGKRSTKIDFVRFDSIETIYKQTDHDDLMQRAKIKDEIKR